jgi:thiamine-phosphate pyrophosphorylase
VSIVQYRHKSLFTQTRFDEAGRVAALCRTAGAMFIMNDRADFARLLGSGVHVGQDDLPAASARALLGPGFPIGLSTHNEQQFRVATEQPVDYVAVGPVFGTRSKSNPDPQVGPETVARLRGLTKLPLVAIGGITIENAADVLESGADSVAVISGLLPERPGSLAALQKRASAWLKAVR